MKKEIIKQNFSRHATLYDRYSDVQRHIASLLLERLNGFSPEAILDIGCGTGWYTNKLSEKYPRSSIQAIDISSNMIECAKEVCNVNNIEFIVGDAEKAVFDRYYDLITSNATLHWFSDLPAALLKFSSILNNEGLFICSIFGPDTYSELSVVLEKFLGEESHISSRNFMTKEEVQENLEKSFSNVTLDHVIYRENYSSLLELLKKIKYTGTRGLGINNAFALSRGEIVEMEKIYIATFGKITATNEIFICRGNAIKGS